MSTQYYGHFILKVAYSRVSLYVVFLQARHYLSQLFSVIMSSNGWLVNIQGNLTNRLIYQPEFLIGAQTQEQQKSSLT